MGTVMVAVESWGFKVRRMLPEHTSYFMGEQTTLFKDWSGLLMSSHFSGGDS